MKTKVRNMQSPNGNDVPNQFIINDENGNRFFQSYSSIIIKIDNNGNVYLDEYYYDYSKTTSKYRNMFLGENSKEINAKIQSGVYKLTNLNS